MSPDRACLFCLYNVFQTRPLLPVSSSIPGQPIFPASLWPCLLHPCPSTHSPFSPQGDGLEPQTRACHFLHKRPSVASRCTWTKTQAPSAGGVGGALNGPSQTPPPTPPPCPRLRHTGLIWLPRAPSSLPPSLCTGDCFYLECSCHRPPTVMPSDSRHFHPQCLFLERGRDGFSPLAPFSLVYLPLSTFY